MRRGSKLNRLMDYWLGTPLLNALATFHRKRARPAQIVRIGVPLLARAGRHAAVLWPPAGPSQGFPRSPHHAHLHAGKIWPRRRSSQAADDRIVISLTSPRETIAAIRALQLDALLDFSSWQRPHRVLLADVRRGSSRPGFLHGRGEMHRSRGYDLVVDHTKHAPRTRKTSARCSQPSSQRRTPPSEPAVVVESALTPFAEEGRCHRLSSLGFRPELAPARVGREANWLALAQQLAAPQTLFVITGAPADTPRGHAVRRRLTFCRPARRNRT